MQTIEQATSQLQLQARGDILIPFTAIAGSHTNIFYSVKVLGHHHHLHDLLVGDAIHIIGELEYTLTEAIHDGLALSGDTLEKEDGGQVKNMQRSAMHNKVYDH